MSATALSQFGALGVSERLVEALERAGLKDRPHSNESDTSRVGRA